MAGDDGATGITEDDVRGLARVAGLPPRTGWATLARALEADLRAIRALRDVDAGETHPAGVSPLPQREQADG